MNFYTLDGALHEAIAAAEKPLRLKIDIHLSNRVEGVFPQDIIEAHFWGQKESSGSVSSRGEVLLENPHCMYSYTEVGEGTKVTVSFSLGENLPFFQRFVFYIDEKGVQDLRGPGRKRYVKLGLLDLSYKLRKSDEAKDWTSPAVFAYTVICDKSQPDKSLLHGIAQRAGLATNDIDCSTIPVTLPYVQLRRNIWAELSSLATAYRCHLECAPEKPLVFAHSPYQSEPLLDEEISHTFTGEDIFFLRKTDRADLYRNSIRFRANIPVSLDRQEIWRYDDPPVFYDDYLQPFYPFRYPLSRQIEEWDYAAKYRIIESNGKERNVIYADQIDTQWEAEDRLDYDGGPFFYYQYDITSNHDKATVKLHKQADGNLYHASIHGRPIVMDLNRSFFARHEGEINRHGTVAHNVTGPYFSEAQIGDSHHFEDWVIRELAERTRRRREFTVKTHRALFHARIGAKAKIRTSGEETTGTITAFSFRHKKNRAFVATFKLLES
jgi:hypothetical protein